LDGDADYTIDNTLNIVGDAVYTQGTYELYPSMLVSDEGHYYMECSNKGICDRETGLCSCFDGYEGVACKRASCPNSCSGHGTCESIKELGLAEWTLHNDYMGAGTASYTLWDADKGMGCKCDPQYFGADCSKKQCKYGVDPLYFTEEQGEVIIDIVDTAANALTGAMQMAFYKHNTTTSTGYLYTGTSITPLVYAAATAVGACDALVNSIYAATDENSNPVAASDLKDLVCEQIDGSAGAGVGARYRLTFNKDPGYLSTLHFAANTVAGGSVTSAITFRPTGSCVATPVVEEVLLLISDTTAIAKGDYRLKFYDVFGEDYITEPISVTQHAAGTTTEDTCNTVVSALLNLPNGVISDVRCSSIILSATDLQYGAHIRLSFYKNPGILKPLTVFETNVAATTSVVIGVGATQGEFVDRFASKLQTSGGVDITVATATRGATTITWSADASTTLSQTTPLASMVKIADRHLLVTADTTVTATLKWMYTGSDITAAQNIQAFYSADIWSLLQDAAATGITITTWAIGSTSFAPNADASVQLTKGTVLFVENQYFTVQYANPNTPWTVYVDKPFGGVQVLEKWTNTAAQTSLTAATTAIYYRSTTATTGTYEYVSPCSNRGTCDYTTGMCACYRGYSGDSCDTQNTLMVV
jgi:hypothetical protein